MKAILSTTVLPIDGVYRVETLKGVERKNLLNSLSGVPHYVGHPDTRAIVEVLGAAQAPSKLFAGLEVGEQAVCFPIKQGLSSRAQEGFTVHQAISEIETLDVRVITRLQDLGPALVALDGELSPSAIRYACAGGGGAAGNVIDAALKVLEAAGRSVKASVLERQCECQGGEELCPSCGATGFFQR